MWVVSAIQRRRVSNTAATIGARGVLIRFFETAYIPQATFAGGAIYARSCCHSTLQPPKYCHAWHTPARTERVPFAAKACGIFWVLHAFSERSQLDSANARWHYDFPPPQYAKLAHVIPQKTHQNVVARRLACYQPPKDASASAGAQI